MALVDTLDTFPARHMIAPLPLIKSNASPYHSEKRSVIRPPCERSLQPGIFSTSLGRPWVHKLSNKINMAHKHGFRGIELAIEDLDHYAKELTGNDAFPDQLNAAKSVRKLCDERNLSIICLQPFIHYEGLRDRKVHEQRIEKLQTWFKLAKALRTEMILIPATFLSDEETTGDTRVIVNDLAKVADLGLQQSPVIRFAYESLCWSTHVDTWEKCWEVVERVNRPNFGICLDTYNIAGRVYADPKSSTGCTPDAEQQMRASVQRMNKTIDSRKIFFIQVVDAEKLSSPLLEGHEFYNAEQPARMSWSRNCRLFYGEASRGAYLPIKQLCEVIINDLSFDGWVSMEMFNRCLTDESESVPEDLARRGIESYQRMMQDLGRGKLQPSV